jgi:hypothetical protein
VTVAVEWRGGEEEKEREKMYLVGIFRWKFYFAMVHSPYYKKLI